jgi:alcohol dehydrogenase class IV
VEGVPFAAAPATAGTGAEATPNAVLTDRSSGAKRSIRAPSMFARLVVLDPQLMAGTPRAVVAAAGMDALTQAVEAFASTGSTRLTRALSREAFLLVQEHLETVHRSGGQDPDAAYGLLQGSFLAGVALAHARLGVVHGLAHPLGAQLHLPHGLVCAFCLGPALRLNRQAMAADYQDLSRAAGRDLQELVQDLLQRLGLENPFAGKTLPDREAAVQETLDSGSTAHNPRPVSRQDVERLLDEILAPAP